MYRIVLSCSGLAAGSHDETCRILLEEFAHRPWDQNPCCWFQGDLLLFRAEREDDAEGLALTDEVSDAISELSTVEDGDIVVVSVETI